MKSKDIFEDIKSLVDRRCSNANWQGMSADDIYHEMNGMIDTMRIIGVSDEKCDKVQRKLSRMIAKKMHQKPSFIYFDLFGIEYNTESQQTYVTFKNSNTETIKYTLDGIWTTEDILKELTERRCSNE